MGEWLCGVFIDSYLGGLQDATVELETGGSFREDLSGWDAVAVFLVDGFVERRVKGPADGRDFLEAEAFQQRLKLTLDEQEAFDPFLLLCVSWNVLGRALHVVIQREKVHEERSVGELHEVSLLLLGLALEVRIISLRTLPALEIFLGLVFEARDLVWRRSLGNSVS